MRKGAFPKTDNSRVSQLKVLIISPFYPSDEYPSFGVFVKKLHQRIFLNRKTEFLYCVRRYPGTERIQKIISYIIWGINSLWTGLTCRQYDVIHVHTIYPAGLLALVVGKLRNKPVLVTVHGGDIHNAIRHKITRWIALYIFRNAKYIQPVSMYIRSCIEQLDANLVDKMVVQCMGVDTTVFKPSDSCIETSGCCRIVFTANLVKKKGWKVAFQTVERLLKNGICCRLDVYGDGDQMPEAKLWVKQHHLNSDIFLHGAVEQELVATALQSADLFLLPSQFYEGFSLAAAEALACGVPIVVSSKGALPDLATESSCSYAVADELDPDKIARACAASLQCSRLKNKESRSSLLHPRHSLEHAAEVVYKMYLTLTD